MSFILKGSQISALQLKGWFKSKTSILKWNTKLILNLCMYYIVHISSIMWRIKNKSSNPTSCSDNALRLLVLVLERLYWELQVTSSFQFEVGFEGLLREVYFEGPNCVWRASKTSISNTDPPAQRLRSFPWGGDILGEVKFGNWERVNLIG